MSNPALIEAGERLVALSLRELSQDSKKPDSKEFLRQLDEVLQPLPVSSVCRALIIDEAILGLDRAEILERNPVLAAAKNFYRDSQNGSSHSNPQKEFAEAEKTYTRELHERHRQHLSNHLGCRACRD